MEIKNELKAIEDIKGAIKRGYGYEQLKAKLDITEEELVDLGRKHPDFLNEVNKRYRKHLGADDVEKPSENIELKGDKVESIREQAKRLGIKNWHNKNIQKLADEIALIEASE